MDITKNFAYGTVLTPPSPAASGTTLVLDSGQGSRFPDPAVDGAYNVVVKPASTIPLSSNAEIVRVTALSTDTLTITRTQEGSSARTIIAGDEVYLSITKKTVDDRETQFTTEHATGGTHDSATVTTLKATGAEIDTGTNDTKIVTPKAIADATVLAKLAGAQTFSGAKSFSTAPKMDTISEKTAGAGVTIDSIKLKDGNTITTTATDHITITPGTSKLVKTAVLRQDNTTDSYKNDQVILTGWGMLNGDAVPNISETVSFGVTFTSVPIVLISSAGAATDASSPDTLDDFTTAATQVGWSTISIGTTSFTARGDRYSGNFSLSYQWAYTWIAIGTL